jgi:hypothetical protein
MKPTELYDYVEHFRMRVLQDALQEATAGYWNRRAEAFAVVGTPECSEIAQACRNRSTLALGGDTTDYIVCHACETPTLPWTCSCGRTRIEMVA